MSRRNGRGGGRCPHDRKSIFRTFEQAASAAARLKEPGTSYWCPQAGGYHIRRGDQADYDRRRAAGNSTQTPTTDISPKEITDAKL